MNFSVMATFPPTRTLTRHPEVLAPLGEPRRMNGPDAGRRPSRPAKTRAPQGDGSIATTVA
jgi:hypothetical protein